MSSLVERLRVRSDRRPIYNLDESDDDADFLPRKPGTTQEKLERIVRTDAKEDLCQACSENENLVSCETCTYAYHPRCLLPPLKGPLPDNWRCPECVSPLNDIDKILDCEMRPTTAADNDATKLGVPEKEFSKAFKTHPRLKTKVNNFHQKMASINTSDDDFVAIRPEWTTVDRILSCRYFRGDDDEREYLVKWKELPYDECYWEFESDISAFQPEIERFNRLRSRSSKFSSSKHKQSVKDDTELKKQQKEFQHYEHSPEFLSGGTLHPYQLEGLNFLRFSWSKQTHVILADEMGLGDFTPFWKQYHATSLNEFRHMPQRKIKFGRCTREGIKNKIEGGIEMKITLENRGVVWFFSPAGKTIQSIAFLASLFEESVSPHLVVAPLSTLRNWEREFATWAPHMNVLMYVGSAQARSVIREYEFYFPKKQKKIKKKKSGQLISENKQERIKFDVLLTSYEMINFDTTSLKPIKWECMIVDEGHRLKNKDSKLFSSLKQYSSRHRVLLTGTPLQHLSLPNAVSLPTELAWPRDGSLSKCTDDSFSDASQNNLDELFMLMHFLDAGKFGSLEEFQEEFRDINQEEQISRLHKMLAPHLLRRVKKDVMKELPPKKELILRVELSSKQKEYYKAILTRNYQILTRRGGAQARLML
ncbi:hypothetical protein V8G54_005432 [Vigna mungo]|uniref:CHD3-type chromatin-remodeling factor PICKLE n=1 Tax=Vigna mungo TaxID=3915 RepID=A0AAQ3NYA5_VIGMU